MKFDYIVGNPPYQEETESESTRKPPVYNLFMDETYKISDHVELITPARFLFNAGYTPKAWNKKMLNDEHFKVLYYEPISNSVFPNTEIKGGIIISYHNNAKKYDPIIIFTKYQELNTILHKVINNMDESLYNIISSPLSYQVTDTMKNENPDLLDRLRTSAFTKLGKIFFEEKPKDGFQYIQMIGLYDNKRTYRYVREDYIKDISDTLNKYKVIIPKANGIGMFGETLSSPVILNPGIGFTQTFIGIGHFDDIREAKNLKKYIYTKFLRAMLGVLKITQDCPGPKWKYVPLQDFTSSSDIDWSQSIADIDRQLYAKYGLDDFEIEFIETHVKEMT